MRLAAYGLLLSFAAPLYAADTYVIAGTVVHSLSRAPLAKARVFLAPSMSKAQPVSVVTAADGRFEFTQVPRGKFTLSVERNGFAPQSYNQRRLYQQYSSAVVTGPGENTTDLVFALVPGAVVSGRVTDVNGDPVPWATAILYRVTGNGESRSARRTDSTTTDDLGYFRFANLAAGRYVLAMQGKPWFAAGRRPDSGDVPAYPLTFYPATTDPAAAELIELSAGQEFNALVAMSPVPTYSIVIKRPANIEGSTPFVAFRGPLVYGADSYSLRSEYLYGAASPMRVPGGRYQFVVTQQAQSGMIAVLDVEVNRDNQEISFDPAPLASIRGTVEFLGSRAKLSAQTAITLAQSGGGFGARRAIETDGTFHMEGLPPGSYAAVVGTRDPYVLRSVVAKGAPVRDGRVILPATGTVELKLVVELETAEVDGRLTSDGRGVTGALVVVAPKGGLRDTWLRRMDQTDSDGSFSWRGLAPGDYLAFVFPDGDEFLAREPDYLQNFAATATSFTVQGAAKQKLELTLPKPQQ